VDSAYIPSMHLSVLSLSRISRERLCCPACCWLQALHTRCLVDCCHWWQPKTWICNGIFRDMAPNVFLHPSCPRRKSRSQLASTQTVASNGVFSSFQCPMSCLQSGKDLDSILLSRSVALRSSPHMLRQLVVFQIVRSSSSPTLGPLVPFVVE